MRYKWPENTNFDLIILEAEADNCSFCNKRLKICDHRHHKFFRKTGPTHLISKLKCCVTKNCENRYKTFSPIEEMSLTMPRWLIDWDVFSWIGHRRFARHWSATQIKAELEDSFKIFISADAIEDHIRLYQSAIAAREMDSQILTSKYQDCTGLILSIDGLQPEKGHETLYVVRELSKKHIWFAEALISSSYEEVRKLFVRAKEWVNSLALPVKLWVSDKQEAFVQGIAKEFSGVPHRYCENHFLRDLAKPVLEADSTAKVKMRRKIRNLRQIEKDILEKKVDEKQSETGNTKSQENVQAAFPSNTPETQDVRGNIIMEYCSAVRGVLNDDQGGPLSPPGMRMAEGIKEIRSSLETILQGKKGGLPKNQPKNLLTA